MALAVSRNAIDFNPYTLSIGVASLLFLFWARSSAAKLLCRFGVSKKLANTLARIAPVVGVAMTTLLVANWSLDQEQVAIVGSIPAGIPALKLPGWSIGAVQALLVPAILISIIGYVESVSVGRTLSAKRHEKIDGNQELIGLGVANIASGFSGAFPVTGGFARSVVNFDAGAQTQVAGIFTAMGLAVAAIFLTPLLYYLPTAMLAATIIVAVLSLVDFSIFSRAWKFSKSDFVAVLVTVILTLTMGVEIGVGSGIVTSIVLHLYHTSEPHIAEVGLVSNSEHFRNVKHYRVATCPQLLSLRVDESLLFSNSGFLEDYINDLVLQRGDLKHVLLQCNAINTIDLSALEMLETLNKRLAADGILLHFSEIKVPVQKLLERSGFLEHLSGEVFLSQYAAFQTLQSDA
jgi:SulP family sulfate permease